LEIFATTFSIIRRSYFIIQIFWFLFKNKWQIPINMV
jgi:hypothetical protein